MTWADGEGKGRTEYDDGYIDRAKNTKLVRLLEEAVLALWINDKEKIIISAKPEGKQK